TGLTAGWSPSARPGTPRDRRHTSRDGDTPTVTTARRVATRRDQCKNQGTRSEHMVATADRREQQATRASALTSDRLSAKLEPFDSFWQAPDDIESGYARFDAYYRSNFLPLLPSDRDASILVISCGPGCLLQVLRDAGYRSVLGIDSFPDKIAYAERRGLNARVE